MKPEELEQLRQIPTVEGREDFVIDRLRACGILDDCKHEWQIAGVDISQCTKCGKVLSNV